ncbi:hypothetical protein LTS15_007225 [Exophiala xenobiotica]|nr:hypothetical protein LTS15_007225 [Exophiala xenobiotica]
MKWIIEARQILHELKEWAPDSKSQEQLAFLEERINGAERIVKKQVGAEKQAEVKEQAEAKEQVEATRSTGPHADFKIGSPEKSHQPSPPETIPSSPPNLMDFVEEVEPRLPTPSARASPGRKIWRYVDDSRANK